jgi:glutathione peroxidase
MRFCKHNFKLCHKPFTTSKPLAWTANPSNLASTKANLFSSSTQPAPAVSHHSLVHRKFGAQGLVILGFPCNQFGAQDAGSNEEIASFCQLNFGVTFPMMAKIDVNGADATPLYKWLSSEAPGLLGSKAIKWNFTKFLVSKEGQVIKRFGPQDAPASLEKDIKAVLA